MDGLPRPQEARNLELVGQCDLGGSGDGMQVRRNGDVAYVGHMGDHGVGTSVVDVSDPRRPRLVRQLPAPTPARSHKVQYADGLLLVNHELFPPPRTQAVDHEVFPPRDVVAETGMAVYDVSRPEDPKRIGFLPVAGLGVHRIWWTGGRYAYASARNMPGLHGGALVTVDLADPEHPRLHAEWHFPEQESTEPDAGIRASRWYPSCHHAIVRGDRAYAGWFDAGVAIFRLDDGRATLLGRIDWTERAGGHPYTHTALPLGARGLLIATDEAIDPDGGGARKDIHTIDLSDERAPREIGTFPVPPGHRDTRGLRFGPHNLHENRPGTYVSDTVVYATYFSAGIRVYDTSDPASPVEVASYVPAPPRGQRCVQMNDLLVDADRTIFATDRHTGGLYVLRHTAA